MSRRSGLIQIMGLTALASLASCAEVPSTQEDEVSAWETCHDTRQGFSIRHPPDWRSTTPSGVCAQFQAGQTDLPEGIPAVDVNLRVDALRGSFPEDYLIDRSFPTTEGSPAERGITYTERRELTIAGLEAVRARFESRGPTPNWGSEYAIRNHDQVMRIYISQPSPETEKTFDTMVHTLDWP